jgi:DNA-binding CsgD family transcriptional regulator/PAS domain-containing protein
LSAGSGLLSGERLTNLIGAAYATGLAADGWSSLANDLRSAFDSDLAIVQYYDHREPERSFVVESGLGHDFLAAFETHCGAANGRDDDLLWKAVRSDRAGSVRLNVDLQSLDEARRTEVHRLLASPWGLDYFMTGVVLNSADASTYISLGRRTDAGCFTSLERHLLGSRLLGHFRSSITLHRGYASAQRQAALYGRVLDAMPDGIVVFDADGQAILANQAADSICAGSGVLVISGGRLETPDAGRQALLDCALQEVLAGPGHAPPAPVYLAAVGANAPVLRVTFLSLVPSGSDSALAGALAGALPAEAVALAIICTASGVHPSALATRYSLTPAEERLCLLLVAGRTLQEAADTLDITRNTAKTHLGRVFDKTGVRSQVALISLLAPILNNR